MFQPTWLSSGNTDNARNTWEKIIGIKYYKEIRSFFLYKIVVMYNVIL
jgi:hypothetical protein